MLRLIYFYYGTLCPGWSTLRAFSRGQKHFIVLWLRYWVIYTFFQGLGGLTDFLFSWLPLYAVLKLILSICLWFSVPYSTNYIYKSIAEQLFCKLGPIIEQSCLVQQRLSHQMLRFFWGVVAPFAPTNSKEVIPLDGELLKRELTDLMAEIDKDELEKRRKHELELRNHLNLYARQVLPEHSGNPDCPLQDAIEYLTQRLGNNN
ncbi:hypothetical protein KR009_011914, partial [Drosophila setifemur]